MLTSSMSTSPDTPAGKVTGPNRYPPQPECPPTDRFATLLQQRQSSQPQTQPPAKASQPEPESRSAPKTAAPRDADGNTQASADSAKAEGAEDTPEAAHAKSLPDGPTLPPQAADEVPASPVAAPPFWPGMPPPGGLVTAVSTTDALASAGGTDPRTGSAANPTLSALTTGRGASGESGAGSQGGSDGSADDDAKAGHAAALLAAAANTDADKVLKAAGDRFALPPRAPLQIETSPGFTGHAGGVALRGAEAAATTSVALPTPLNAPDFAKALGAQVSLFARNGLAQAELQLNPADMGPIRVQIAIEGAHARVDFAADAAATRQVIERGLPELATALREQGLTLSGGGVFQRAPDQRGDADTPAAQVTRGASRRVGESVAAEGVAPAAHARASAALRGGVDLYA